MYGATHQATGRRAVHTAAVLRDPSTQQPQSRQVQFNGSQSKIAPTGLTDGGAACPTENRR